MPNYSLYSDEKATHYDFITKESTYTQSHTPSQHMSNAEFLQNNSVKTLEETNTLIKSEKHTQNTDMDYHK